jgi:hypothetical protein
MADERVKKLELFAWVGEDELGSGEIGLKQALTPVGMIPLAAIHEHKMDQDYLVKAMKAQAKAYGKRIQLCRFVFDGVVRTVE